ncbi:MAG: FecR domain-containing protein [Kofleriaceae bacterium]|nr:FecR domain-containing protein [Kofleriaceae bacterium]
MRHVAPHRWADAAAGLLDARELARMASHVAGCAACARARDRIAASREAFADIAQAPAPELSWEHVGARVYWASSRERRERESGAHRIPAAVLAPRRRWAWIGVPAAATLAVASILWWRDGGPRGPAAGATPAPATAQTGAQPGAQPGAPGLEVTPVELIDAPGVVPAPMVGLVTLAQGDAGVVGVPLERSLEVPVTMGTALATGDGRLSVQLEAGTAFALGPGSRLEVARLDRAAIELRVDGEVTVEVSHRGPGQRFLVVAGTRVVEVRGTAFSVRHQEGRLEVACSHGLVAVSDPRQPDDVAEVAAGRHLELGDGDPLTAAAPAPLDADGLAALIAAAPQQLPAWTDAATLTRTSAPLAVAAPRGRAVRIDGVAIGVGTVSLRVMSGRHLVEIERGAGRYGPGQWLTTRDDGRAVRVDVAADDARAERRAAATTRRRQLEARVDHAAVGACLRGLAKQGLAAGTFVEVEIGVDDTGAVSFLNVGATDLPASTAGCVRDAIARARFPAGPEATWRHRFTF